MIKLVLANKIFQAQTQGFFHAIHIGSTPSQLENDMCQFFFHMSSCYWQVLRHIIPSLGGGTTHIDVMEETELWFVSIFDHKPIPDNNPVAGIPTGQCSGLAIPKRSCSMLRLAKWTLYRRINVCLPIKNHCICLN